ncbi:IS5 family transposase [Streptomyces sp. NBC_00539]|uniref:IS5 family transposase n=1 Tax=Streptomyces sp. NBC_00539 TaxID=2975770 RepID=UPI003FCCFD08
MGSRRHVATDLRSGPLCGGCRRRHRLDRIGGLHCVPGSPARRRCGEKGAAGRAESADHELGRSRGGLSTKVHLASGDRARPLALFVTAGQAGDAPAFEAAIGPNPGPSVCPGRPRTRPTAVLADRAYSSRAIRGYLRLRGIRAVIPQHADQIGHRVRRGQRGGRPPAFDAETYKQRNTVERCINRFKQRRGLAMRTDKLAIAFQAALHLAAILIRIAADQRQRSS